MSEEVRITMEERFANMRRLVKEANVAYADGKIEDAFKAVEELNGEVELYNEILRYQEYDKWLAEENPVLTAIKQAIVTQVGIKRSKIKDTGIPQLSLDTDKQVMVDLIAFDDYALDNERQVFALESWRLRVDRVLKFVNARLMRDFRSEDGRSCDKYVSEMLEGEGKDLMSNTSLKQFCQDCIDGIIGEGFTFKTKDVRYILGTAARQKSGGLKVATDVKKVVLPRQATLVKLLTSAMYRIVTDGEYEQDVK